MKYWPFDKNRTYFGIRFYPGQCILPKDICIDDIINTDVEISSDAYGINIEDKHVGRESDDEIIIFSVGGMPVEDIAWGHEVYKNAVKEGIGITLPLWDKPDMA